MGSRVLFTGLGSIGRRHLDVVRESSEEMDVLAYRSGESEEVFEDVTEFDSLDAALAEEPDIAFVTNPTHKHVETALACAKAGCDMLVEKPLSNTLEAVDRLIDVVEQNGLITLMGCQLRFDPVLQFVDDRLRNHALGEVYSFDVTVGSYLPDWRPGRDYRKTYSAKKSMGGGVVLDLIHEIDYARWLFGDLESVKAHVGSVSALDIETEDIAEIICRTTNGAIGRIHQDYFRRRPKRCLEVVCSDGVVEADIQNHTVDWTTLGDEHHRSFDYERNERFRRQFEYFLEHVKTDTPCENDVVTGKRVLQTALKVRGELDDR